MIYDDERVRERILKLMHREGLSQIKFSEKIGKKQSNVSDIMRGRRNVTKEFLLSIYEAFPDVNKDWLFFGEGKMYDDDKEIEVPKDTRPRLPKPGSDGHLEDYYAGPKRCLCTEKPIITQFADYDFTLILKSDRMIPKYRPGDELAFKKSTIITWGDDYLLDTPEGAKFKRIFDAGDSVKCVSYNKDEYPEFYIPKDMIIGYYRLVGAIRIL